MGLYLLPYKMGSQGCKNFAQALGIKRLKREVGKFRGSNRHTVINWGCASTPRNIDNCRILNKAEGINTAGNKLLAFKQLSTNDAINLPEWTSSKDDALAWIEDGSAVVCRTVLRGHSGQGIVMANTADELVDAPLYVKYVKKTHEFRLHILNGEMFDIQRKMRNREIADEDVNWQVRNHDNGFIFGREGVEAEEAAIEQSALAVQTLGLDFGAVDLIYNKKDNKYVVIEVNTAPGLTGTTLDNYVEAFKGVGDA